MGFSRQEYWGGLPFPFPEDLLDPGMEPGSPAFQAILYCLSHQGSPEGHGRVCPKAAPPLPMSAPILANTETHTPQSHRGLTRQHKNIPMHTAHRLVIEDSKGPEVTLQVLSDSLLQVTLRSKLYLSLQR